MKSHPNIESRQCALLSDIDCTIRVPVFYVLFAARFNGYQCFMCPLS
jgi:hypothetical protein